MKNLQLTSNPQTVSITTDEITFRDQGIAAQLALSVKVTCSDGRSNTSLPLGTIFLPAPEVFELPNDEYVVSRYFFADGSGDLTTFVGCAADTGGNVLVRVNRRGEVLSTIDRSDVVCDDTAVFTEPAGGVRWMLVPGVGALAFDFNLHVTSVARTPWFLPETRVLGDTIAINPEDGDAIIWRNPISGSLEESNLFRVRSHCLQGACPQVPPTGCRPETLAADTPVVWAIQLGQNPDQTPFNLLGDPLVVDQLVVTAGYLNDIGNYVAHHQVRYVAYECGSEQFQLQVELVGSDIRYGVGEVPHSEFMSFNPASSIVYLPFVTRTTPSVVTEIRAFDATHTGSPVWKSPLFQTEITQVVPFAGGTRLAARSTNSVWFLNAADGTVLNPANPATAYGRNQIAFIDAGPNQEVSIMAGPLGAPAPTELITYQNAFDEPVVHYNIGAGSLFARFDSGGQLWLRFNAKLARLYSSEQYVALRNR